MHVLAARSPDYWVSVVAQALREVVDALTSEHAKGLRERAEAAMTAEVGTGGRLTRPIPHRSVTMPRRINQACCKQPSERFKGRD